MQCSFYQRFYSKDILISKDIQFAFKSANKISEEAKQQTNQPITEDELYKALKGLKKNRAPGCDGLAPELFLLL